MPSNFVQISVVVPIYNAFQKVVDLVYSIVQAYPLPQNHLHFYFLDDASTSEELKTWMIQNPFFQRTDVSLTRNDSNLGFTKSVNRLFGMANENSDVVILNSDTLIFSGVFENLQKAAAMPFIATVTPLSNKATISSIMRWPSGTEVSSYEDEKKIHEIVRKLPDNGFPTLIDIPTGVGFCLYVKRDALNRVGLLDDVNFPRGYGEENDWCQRAIKLGYRHCLYLGEYVSHASGASFQKDSEALIKLGLEKLRNLHPHYEADVHKFIETDVFKSQRAWLTWQILETVFNKKKRPFFLQILHSDPTVVLGGTESYSRFVRDELVMKLGYQQAMAYFTEQSFGLVYFPENGLSQKWEFSRNETTILALWDCLLSLADIIHVQHTMHTPAIIFRMISEVKTAKKIITLHDYYQICPTIQLIDHQSKHCQIPSDLDKCKKCLSIKAPQMAASIESYRSNNLEFLNAFDEIITPSKSAKEILIRGMETSLASNTQKEIFKQKIKNIDNPYEMSPGYYKKRILAKNGGGYDIAFLGAISTVKGAELIDKALPKLKRKKLTTCLIGKTSSNFDKAVDSVFEFDSPEALKNIADQVFPGVVCMPALWPETFCYVLYESLHLFDVPVIVGPYGHPAQLVEKYGLGCVMKNMNPESLVAAATDAIQNRDKFIANIKKWRITEALEQQNAREKLRNIVSIDQNQIRQNKEIQNRFQGLVQRVESYRSLLSKIENPGRERPTPQIIFKNWLGEVESIQMGSRNYLVRDRGLDGQVDDITVGPLGNCRIFAWSIDTKEQTIPQNIFVFIDGAYTPAEVLFYNCKHAMEKVGKGNKKLLKCGIDIRFKISNFWPKSKCDIQIFTFFSRGVACELGCFRIAGGQVENSSRKLKFANLEMFEKTDQNISFINDGRIEKKFRIESGSKERVLNVDEVQVKEGEVFASGWAAHLDPAERASVLLAFNSKECVAAFPIQAARYHLVEEKNIPELEASGFYGYQHGDKIKRGDDLIFYALWKSGIAIPFKIQ